MVEFHPLLNITIEVNILAKTNWHFELGFIIVYRK